jgi:hypothetical protein
MVITEKAFLVLASFVLTIMAHTQISGDNYEQVFVFAMGNEEPISLVEVTNSYVQISTQPDNENERVTEGLCNKLLESCPTPHTESGSDDKKSTTEPDSAAGISEKYFEHPDQKIPTSPLTGLESAQNTTLAIDSLGQPSLLNQSNITQAETEFETYENSNLGFKILQPTGWEKIENNTDRFSLITLLSPQESTSDSVVERLVLRINNYPTNMTLDEYSTRVKNTLDKNSNFNVINFSTTYLSSNPAYGVVGTENQGDKKVDVIDYWTIKDGIVYRIVFYSDDAKSDVYLPIREKMIDSFSITR